jgi:hypothetical protein
MRSFTSYIVDLYFRFAFIRRIPWLIVVVALFTLGAALVFQNNRVSTKPVGWEKSFQLSSFNIVARDVTVSSRGDIIAAAYEGVAGGAQGIYVSLSFDGGVTFLPSIRVAGVASKTSMNPHAAISPSGAVTVMWHGYLEDESTSRIFYSTSKDLGATWSEPTKLTLGYDMEMLPRVYYDDRSALHLFFHGSEKDNINLYHAISEDGQKFETTGTLIRLTSSMRGAFFPSIKISGKNFFMAWQGKEENFSDEIFFMKSSNYGRSWSFKKQITSSNGNNDEPSIVMHDNALYVVYQNNEEKNWVIKMVRSYDMGWRWDDVPLTVSTTLTNCYSPAIGSAGSDLMIVWYDTRDGGSHIYARKYVTRDRSFQPETGVSEALYQSRNPALLSIGKRLLVFWEERNVIMAKQTDVYVEPPVVFSQTNPDGVWSKIPYVIMQWRAPADESGIVGYAALKNEIPDFNPTIVNIKPNQAEEKITDNITDGVSYYHIRAVDGAGNYSRTVHYKLLLAVNPLPGPVVVSPTHQQGMANRSGEASFTWAIDEPERVKGFVYSLSKDSIRMPDQFTTDMKMQFDSLEEGTYFFSVAAVDKTNQYSRVSTYDFMVGQEDRVIDPEYYKRLAEEEKKFQKYNEYRKEYQKEYRKEAPAPAVAIQFPFDSRKTFDKKSFKAIIIADNIRRESILGYSIYIDDEKREVADHINHKGAVIEVNGLASGDYYIGVKCKYAGYVNGTVRHYWTSPYVARITVVLPAEQSPVIHYARRTLDKFPRRFGYITLTFVGLGLVMTTLGFGSRLSFYFRLLWFRLKILYRLMIEKK